MRLGAIEGIATTVVAYTTDIPAFGGAWGEPFLIGPGTIHVAHTLEERVPKAELARSGGNLSTHGKGIMQTRIEVGILGATGMVGQHFIKFLQGHPWFDLTWLGASDRSAGKKYRDAMTWHLAGGTPDSVAGLTVEECKPGNAPRLLFSAMDACVATEIERAFAEAGHVVVSNSQQSPHGAGRAAAGARDQPGPPEADPRPAEAPRLEGADRHQSQLLHGRAGHGARAP